MQDLLRLVKIISEYGQATNPLLSLQDDSILEARLFQLLQSGQVQTDEEAAQALYGSSDQGSSYRMLKSRFRKKLYNHLHFLQFKEEGDAKLLVLYYECRSLLLKAFVLRNHNEYKAALKLLDQVYSMAKRVGLTRTTVEVLNEKLLIYSLQLKIELYKEAYDELVVLEELDLKERKAKLVYYRVMMAYKEQARAGYKTAESLEEAIQEIEQLWLGTKSLKILSYLNKLYLLHYENHGEYDGIIAFVEQVETLLEQEQLNSDWPYYEYNSFMKVYALLQTKQYDKGIAEAATKAHIFNRNSLNWFAFMENYVILALHSRKYKLAYQLLSQAVAASNFDAIAAVSKERWTLFYDYLCLICEEEQHMASIGEKVTVEYSLLRKEKKGYNLPIVVLETIQSYKENINYSRESLAERIRKYSIKYLKGEGLERPKIFMRMLYLCLSETNLTKVKLQGAKLLEQLCIAPQPAGLLAEAEIVPYEHLWELILKVSSEQNYD